MATARTRAMRQVGELVSQVRDLGIATAEHFANFIRGSYRAADNPRRRPGALDGSGDYHLDDRSRRLLRELSRGLERNSAVYSGPISTWLAYLVGDGPWPVPKTASESWNQRAAALFRRDSDAKAIDARGLMTWPQQVESMARSVCRDGDLAVVHNPDGTITLLESDRIASPTLASLGVPGRNGVIGGIKLGSRGEPQGLWYTTMPVGATVAAVGTAFLAAHQFTFMAWRTRSSQTRGLPVATPSMDDIERLDSLWESEVVAAESASLPWMKVERQANAPGTGAALPLGQRLGAPKGIDAVGANGQGYGWVKTDSGAIMGLPDGLTGSPWSPNRPNLDVPAFSKLMMRVAILDLGCPYELLFQDLNQLNYSASRAIRGLAQRALARWRNDILGPALKRVYLDRLRQYILAGELEFREDFDTFEWRWQKLDEHDRIKERQADAIDLANGTTNLHQLLGADWQQTLRDRAEEITLGCQLARQLSEQFPEAFVSWRDFLGDPAKIAAAMVIAPEATEDPKARGRDPDRPESVTGRDGDGGGEPAPARQSAPAGAAS